MEASKGSQKNTHEFIVLSEDEYLDPILDPYARKLSDTPIEELIDNYNLGPTKADGSINFECHCVAHLVASQCGHGFRQEISCQKSTNNQELTDGACADEFIKFMECVTKTNCFRKSNDEEPRKDDEHNS